MARSKPRAKLPAPPAYDHELGAEVGKRGRPGQPRKFTPERRQVFLDALASGTFRVHACRYVGVSTTTLATEMRRDPAFKAAVHKAELQGTVTAAACLVKAAKKSWKAALAYLERKHPKEWRRHIDLLTQNGGISSADAIALLEKKLLGDDPDAPPPPAPGPGAPPDAGAPPLP